MLETISLKFSERPDPLVVPAQGVTVFVGPNNAGKSLVLRELETALSTNGAIETKLLKEFNLIWPTDALLEDDITRLQKRSPAGMPVEHIYVGRFTPAGQLDAQQVQRSSLADQFKQRNKHWVASQFLKFFLI